MYTSFVDGLVFERSEFFREHPGAIRLLFYYDDVEIVNPLGSKTGVHKIAAFYVIIMNFSLNSQLASIHTVLLCYEQDLKKYGFPIVLREFMNDITTLENGVEMFFDGEPFMVYATIAVVNADSLAAHALFNLLSPSAKKFCRLCTISRDDLQSGHVLPAAPRTQEVYEQHLAFVKENLGDAARRTETGVAGDCVLHSSCNFRLYNNWVLDILHDLFEGVVQYSLKLVIHEYVIVQKLCSVEDLNRSVHSFNYGFTDVKNKPSANFSGSSLRNLTDHTLKQKGAQVWCLLRIFPFLFNDLIEQGDEHMELVLLLIRIVEILVAPKIPRSILPYLEEMIVDYLELFRELFPNMPLLNKHHHLAHYPECIRQTGPPVLTWCMRFEGANALLNRHGKVMCNFRNAPKTLVRIGQFQQMETWGHGRYNVKRVSSSQGSSVEVISLVCAQRLKNLGFKDSDKVFSTAEVSVKGTKYRLSMFVCVKTKSRDDGDLPIFGKIKEIIIIHQDLVFFLVSLHIPAGFDPDLHAYPVLKSSPGDRTEFLSIEQLADFKPLSARSSPKESDRVFLSFHHLVA